MRGQSRGEGRRASRRRGGGRDDQRIGRGTCRVGRDGDRDHLGVCVAGTVGHGDGHQVGACRQGSHRGHHAAR